MWESAERVQKNANGEFRAMINGQWVPVEKAQKNASGQYRVMLAENQPAPEPPAEQPSGNRIQEAYGAMVEPVRHFASAIAAEPIADVAGLATPFLPDFLTGGREPQEVQNLVRDTLTYDPKTQAGKAATESPYHPINIVGNALGGLAKGASSFRDEDKPAYHPQNIAANAVQEAIPQGLAVYGAKGQLPPGVATATKPIRYVGNALREVKDTIIGNVERIHADYIKGQIGKAEYIEKISKVLEENKQLVPGSQPTVAELVSQMPEGSPLVAHQKIVSTTPGGVSAEFGQRIFDQNAARSTAKTMRDMSTKSLRENALSKANIEGVKASGIIQNIDDMLAKPGQRASDVVNKTLKHTKEKIEFLTNKKGVIDANDLYMVRKETGNVIKANSKETANFDKKLSAGLQKDIQTIIDDAIEKSGGVGWKEYLQKYSEQTKAISDDIARSKMQYKPPQKTSLQKGVNVVEGQGIRLPRVLSTPIVVANYLLSKVGHGIEPAFDAISKQRLLNPPLMVESLKNIPPSTLAELMALTARGAAITAPSTAGDR